MKKLLKKNKPTEATYFKSESQRKKTSRLSFIYGSKRLVAIITVVVLASGIAGVAILQKQKGSKAATLAYSIQASPDNPTAMYTPQWSVQGGGAASAQIDPHPLLLSFPVGSSKAVGQKTCWAYAVPGDVTLRSVYFNITTNSDRTTGVKIEYYNAATGEQLIAGPFTATETRVVGGNVPTPQAGGFARVCFEVSAGTPAGSFSTQRTVYVNGINFSGDKYTPDAPAPVAPVVTTVKIIGTVRDNSGAKNPISGVTISNCQSTTTTDKNGQFSFTVNKDSGFCVRTQEGLDPNVYLDVHATNTNKSGIKADSVTYEQQIASGTQMTNYDFTARLKPAAASAQTPTPATPAPASCASEAKVANTLDRPDATKFEIVSSLNPAPAQISNETGADGCTAVVLFRNGQHAEYTFTTPNAKGKYNFLVRAASKVSENAKATIQVTYLSNNASLGDATLTKPAEYGKTFTTVAALSSEIPELAPNTKVRVSVSFLDGTTKAKEDINLWVDYIEMRKVDSPATTTPATTAPTTGTTAPGSTGSVASVTNPNCELNTTVGLTVPAQSSEGKKGGDAATITDGTKKVVKLKTAGDSVLCVVKLPENASPGNYVVAYSGKGINSGPDDLANPGAPGYHGALLTTQMSGGDKGTQLVTKNTAGDVEGLAYSNNNYTRDRMPIIREGANKTIRFLKPGELVAVKVTLKKDSTHKGDYLLDNISFYKDPCGRVDGTTINDGSSPVPGVKCPDPAKAPATTTDGKDPAKPTAPTTGSGTTTAAPQPIDLPDCKAGADFLVIAEAEESTCVPNHNKVATEDGVKSVMLRVGGDYVEYSFIKNTTPGRYRAEGVVKRTGSGAYIDYKLIKVVPGKLRSTTGEARFVTTTFAPSTMVLNANYQELSQDEINAGAYLTVRAVYRNTNPSGEVSRLFVDKLIMRKVAEATPKPAQPAVTKVTTPQGVVTVIKRPGNTDITVKGDLTPEQARQAIEKVGGGITTTQARSCVVYSTSQYLIKLVSRTKDLITYRQAPVATSLITNTPECSKPIIVVEAG